MTTRIARLLPAIAIVATIAILGTGCAADSAASSVVGTWGSESKGQPSLTFAENGSVTGTDGCNGISSTYRLDGDRIVVEQFMSTMMACQGVDPWLNGLSSAVIDGDALIIENAAGVRIGELARS